VPVSVVHVVEDTDTEGADCGHGSREVFDLPILQQTFKALMLDHELRGRHEGSTAPLQSKNRERIAPRILTRFLSFRYSTQSVYDSRI